jgi:uridine kinase
VTEDSARTAVIGQIAALISQDQPGHPARVAIDGVTAAGKSTFARELSSAVAARGRPVIHLTMDGYHHRRAHRHRRGRMSATGYYDDAYDFAAFARLVLIPLGPGGDRRYRERIIDLASDLPVTEAPATAPADGVLIVDGSFLQRPELAGHWDHCVFLDTSLDVARSRGVRRDAAQFGGPAQAEQLYAERYHAACRRYLDAVRPAERATLVIDHNDLAHPRVVRGPLPPRP